jgi:hypothetical protein
MKNPSLQFWIFLVVSIIAGVLIAMMDTSPNWDDTGVTVGAILLITFVARATRPDFAWLWALIIGGLVLGFNLVLKPGYGAAIALVFAFVGAYAGSFMRKVMK